jgi:hypothetical protein
MITFNSSITGTLTQINTVYSNGASYCWSGYYTVNQGMNTIWLYDCLCTTLSCQVPGKITALVFVIDGKQYTVPVTPTTGNPIATSPTSGYQIFLGCGCFPPSPSPSPIQVTFFVIADDCTGPYCWGVVGFDSRVAGTLTQILTVYSNGSSYCWAGNYTVNYGPNSIWLNDIAPCNHLSCNPPGKITALVFVIDGKQYTVPVTPTTGNPIGTISASESQIFLGGLC